MKPPQIEKTYPNRERPNWHLRQVVEIDGEKFMVTDWITERSLDGNTTYFLRRVGDD